MAHRPRDSGRDSSSRKRRQRSPFHLPRKVRTDDFPRACSKFTYRSDSAVYIHGDEIFYGILLDVNFCGSWLLSRGSGGVKNRLIELRSGHPQVELELDNRNPASNVRVLRFAGREGSVRLVFEDLHAMYSKYCRHELNTFGKEVNHDLVVHPPNLTEHFQTLSEVQTVGFILRTNPPCGLYPAPVIDGTQPPVCSGWHLPHQCLICMYCFKFDEHHWTDCHRLETMNARKEHAHAPRFSRHPDRFESDPFFQRHSDQLKGYSLEQTFGEQGIPQCYVALASDVRSARLQVGSEGDRMRSENQIATVTPGASLATAPAAATPVAPVTLSSYMTFPAQFQMVSAIRHHLPLAPQASGLGASTSRAAITAPPGTQTSVVALSQVGGPSTSRIETRKPISRWGAAVDVTDQGRRPPPIAPFKNPSAITVGTVATTSQAAAAQAPLAVIPSWSDPESLKPFFMRGLSEGSPAQVTQWVQFLKAIIKIYTAVSNMQKDTRKCQQNNNPGSAGV